MSCITISSLAKAVPPLYQTQHDAYNFLSEHSKMSVGQQNLYERIMIDGPIKGRYFGMDVREEALIADPDALNERYLKHGRQIAAQAACQAMKSAGVKPEDIRGLVVNSCTGYLCPGLSSYLCEDLKLNDHVHVLDVMGMGCGGAIPNLRSAVGLIRSGLGHPVMSVAIEICSATIFMDDDPALTVSNAIFGDGAAAVVLQETDQPARGEIEVLDFETVIDPSARELLRYRQQDGRLRNQLSVKVPVVGARLAQRAAERILSRQGLVQEDIAHWAVHAGGTSVLDQVRRQLDLSMDDLHSSYQVFEQYGNISSPSVLFVLMEEIQTQQPEAGAMGLLLSFGAGFTAFACLIRFA